MDLRSGTRRGEEEGVKGNRKIEPSMLYVIGRWAGRRLNSRKLKYGIDCVYIREKKTIIKLDTTIQRLETSWRRFLCVRKKLRQEERGRAKREMYFSRWPGKSQGPAWPIPPPVFALFRSNGSPPPSPPEVITAVADPPFCFVPKCFGNPCNPTPDPRTSNEYLFFFFSSILLLQFKNG